MASKISWSRIAATTLVNDFPGEEVEILRSRRLFALLESRGRVMRRVTGDGWRWRVKYKQGTAQPNDGTTTREFRPINRWKTAELSHRGYQATDTIQKGELLINSGKQGIIKVADQIKGNLSQDLKDAIAQDLYIDGDLVGNTDRFQGLETLFGINGTVDITQSAGTTANRTSSNQADLVGYPSDSYAGIQTQLGYYQGAQANDGGSGAAAHWPNGRCDAHFDFWAPLYVNYNSTSFGGAAANWLNQCIEALRFGIIHSNRNDSKDGQIELILLDRYLYEQALNKLDAKERAIVTNTLGIRSFGFKNVFEIDGVEVSHEYGVPSGVGYGFNVGQIDLLSLQEQLMVPDGPRWEQRTQSWNTVVDVLGNLRFRSIRNLVKWGGITAAE